MCFEFLQQPFQNTALDDRVAIFAGGGDEVEGVAVVALADAVDATQALFQASRVPRHVVIDHQVAELEVDAFASRLCGHAYLSLSTELFLGTLAFVRIHAAMNFAGGVTPAGQVLLDVIQRVAVLGKQQQFAATILEFRELSPFQARLEGLQLRVIGGFANSAGLFNEVLQGSNLGTQLIEFVWRPCIRRSTDRGPCRRDRLHPAPNQSRRPGIAQASS